MPSGTTAEDIQDAVRAAWSGGDHKFAREVARRYIDGNGKPCCGRCGTFGLELYEACVFELCKPCIIEAREHGELEGIIVLDAQNRMVPW